MGFWLFIAHVLIFTVWLSQATVISLTSSNFQDVLRTHDFVLVNFYAEWCRFSRDLAPIFMSTGEHVAMDFKDGQVVLGRVDCDDQGSLCVEHGITKYPTLRLFKFGQRCRSEYRNQRSVEAFLTYLREQMANPIKNLTTLAEVDDLETTRSMVGVFPSFSRDNMAYMNYYKLAHLINDCTFYGVQNTTANSSSVKFILRKNPTSTGDTNNLQQQRQQELTEAASATPEVLNDFETLRSWAAEHCTPLVRELTFANAEEITEPRLPLLILFYAPNDATMPERFIALMEKHFVGLRSQFVPLVANGEVFSHPLMHMGKTVHDLPVMAIDSFQHMFLYPGNLDEALKDPAHIKQFLADLLSEKLHRQFHGMPEPKIELKSPEPEVLKKKPQTPSVFKLLTPSTNRYSLLKDEL